ncbi:MAG: NAD(P)H-dependent oxidoreductase subunit E [Anaerolineaceae bacterium]|nr:NAD(P)H-dependent oxidoreductase subunit E [Anaerolineaceae bacterium]
MENVDLTLLHPLLEKFSPEGRTALLPALHEVQDLYGYVPEQAAVEISKSLQVPLADIHGVLEFYSLLYNAPVAKTVVHVCTDPVCAMAGADSLFKVMNRKLELHELEGEDAPAITLEKAPCLGLCEHAPALMVRDKPVAPASPSTWEDIVTGKTYHANPIIAGDISVLTAGCQRGKPSKLADYLKVDGYSALQKALQISPEAVIAEVKASGLVGRGGAAFPTGLKWEGAAGAAGSPKYLVCNADEAEPGTFKDRIMMETMPHRVLEGIIIAAYAIGAPKGYMYIRGEYTIPYRTMSQAIEEARQAGYLGENILGSSFTFDLELRRGAGAYICGEETALFESIEGKRGFPRAKPPFPTTSGLFGKPTVINNVETLCNVPIILNGGAANYRKIGTEKSPGPKLFCMSGDVKRPGLYEVPFGVTFRHLLEDLAGGVRSGKQMRAALFGGAAGAFAAEEDLDVRLTFEDLRSAGLPLGSGVITVFDETRNMLDICLRLARFFAEESCGKCYPCQIGTQRQYEILQRVVRGDPLRDDFQRLQDLGQTMTDASLCGLGQTASLAISSAMRLWPELFQPKLWY